jgi:hypothetical protein
MPDGDARKMTSATNMAGRKSQAGSLNTREQRIDRKENR